MSAPPTPEDLAAQAVPLPTGAKLQLDAGDIPLPPAHLVDELDNQGAAGDVEPSERAAEVATLDFFGDELPEWTHPLRFKFRWEGRPVTEITVRQLNVAQMGAIFQRARAAGRAPDLYEVYAEMTGLPAKVLRALKAVDGDAVTEKCWDFLPPSLRPATE